MVTTQTQWATRKVRGYIAGEKPRVVPITEAQVKDWPATVYWLGGKYYGVRSENNTDCDAKNFNKENGNG